jgi:DNA-binding transcriptional MerR regulator
LLTIAAIAKQLNIPESTIRFYRDRFSSFIPVVGTGRNKRYRPEAVEVLQYIAEAYKRNEPQWQIEESLGRMVAINIEATDETAMIAAATQQQHSQDLTEQFKTVLGQMATAMEVMSIQKQEIYQLQQHVANIEEKQLQQQEFNDWAKNRDEQTTSLLMELRESKKPKSLFTSLRNMFNRNEPQ